MDKFLGKFVYKIICKIIDGFTVEDLERLELKVRLLFFEKKFVAHHRVSFLNWQIPPLFWNDFTPPWRPSKDDMKNYTQTIFSLNRNCRILILGATPELRNLVASLGFKPVVADFSLSMFVEMMKYMRGVNVDNEIWVKSDWLNMPLSTGFDVILGDLVLKMVETNRQEEFLNKIKEILSPQGTFVTRVHFVDESLFDLTGDEILDMSSTILDRHSTACTIGGRVLDKFSDLDKNAVSLKEAIEFMRDTIKKVRNLREKDIFSKSLEFISRGIEQQPDFDISRPAYNKFQLDSLIRNFFNISDIKISGDYPDSEFYPIYFLKNK